MKRKKRKKKLIGNVRNHPLNYKLVDVQGILSLKKKQSSQIPNTQTLKRKFAEAEKKVTVSELLEGFVRSLRSKQWEKAFSSWEITVHNTEHYYGKFLYQSRNPKEVGLLAFDCSSSESIMLVFDFDSVFRRVEEEEGTVRAAERGVLTIKAARLRRPGTCGSEISPTVSWRRTSPVTFWSSETLKASLSSPAGATPSSISRGRTTQSRPWRPFRASLLQATRSGSNLPRRLVTFY